MWKQLAQLTHGLHLLSKLTSICWLLVWDICSREACFMKTISSEVMFSNHLVWELRLFAFKVILWVSRGFVDYAAWLGLLTVLFLLLVCRAVGLLSQSCQFSPASPCSSTPLVKCFLPCPLIVEIVFFSSLLYTCSSMYFLQYCLGTILLFLPKLEEVILVGIAISLMFAFNRSTSYSMLSGLAGLLVWESFGDIPSSTTELCICMFLFVQ